MLHFASPPPTPPQTIVDDDEQRARAYIDAVRACGLVIFPWRSGQRGVVMLFGSRDDGPNDFSEGMKRLMAHPAGRIAEGCRKGVVHETLCREMGVDPDDPDLCRKVNVMLDAAADRVAS